MQKTLIFDLDGTLIDSSDGIVEAFNYALNQNGLPSQPRDEIVRHIGFSLDHMFGEFTNSNFEALKKDFTKKAKYAVVDSTKPLDGAVQAVVSLFENGYELGIATTKWRTNIDGILDKLGWNEYFSEVIGGDEVTKVKPDPEMFSSLMTLMKAEPEATVIIGDTINDILPAKKLSVKSIAVRSPHGNIDDMIKLEPDYFIDEISDLPKVITKMFKPANSK